MPTSPLEEEVLEIATEWYEHYKNKQDEGDDFVFPLVDWKLYHAIEQLQKMREVSKEIDDEKKAANVKNKPS